MKVLRWVLIVVVVLGAYLSFWPVPVEPVAWDAPEDRGLVDPFAPNDRLEIMNLVDLDPFHGPEDVTFGFNNLLYSGTEDGKIISFQADGSDRKVFAEVGGRPLGLEFSGGFLYVANAHLGLQRIRQDGRVVVVTDTVDGTPILYADDVAVAKDGTVYFSDASTKFGAKEWDGTYSASLLDIMEHGSHGRIIKYDPFSDTTSVVMDGLNFANGIAISDDQQYLLVAETGSYRIWRHWLEGDRAGESEVILDNLPGFPDNINNGLNGRFWVGLIAPRSKILDDNSGKPFTRKVMQRMPQFLRPKAVPSTHLIGISGDGDVLMNLMDTQARFPAVTGAIESRQNIYLSSLFGNRIAVVRKKDLD